MKSINVHELQQLLNDKADIQVIDVREPFEAEICSIGATLIPMNEVPERFKEITKDKQVVVHCRSGARSANVINYLEQTHGYSNLYNLEGGILAWASEIDPSLPTY